MTLERETAVFPYAAMRRLGRLRDTDLRVPRRDFLEADEVIVIEENRAQILKDRHNKYQHLPRDPDGCVELHHLTCT